MGMYEAIGWIGDALYRRLDGRRRSYVMRKADRDVISLMYWNKEIKLKSRTGFSTIKSPLYLFSPPAPHNTIQLFGGSGKRLFGPQCPSVHHL
jgi:hypothetical protein